MLFALKEMLDKMATPVYRACGSRPWRAGYYTAKKKTICSAIDRQVFAHGRQLPPGYGYRIDERVVEYPWVFHRLCGSQGKILDAGSALNYRFLVQRPPVKDSQLTIMTLAPEKRCFWHESISYVFGDLRQTNFKESAFDTVISISTIEHIGLDNTLIYTKDLSKRESNPLGFLPAVSEFKRVLKPGGVCLITVPFGRRGLYGWYQVFDRALVMKVIDTFHPAAYTIDYFGYIADGWQRVDGKEIEDAMFFDVHEKKPFLSHFPAGAGGLACINMTR